MVVSDTEVASVPADVLTSDRYDLAKAVRVNDGEMSCYSQRSPVTSLGKTYLYKRTNSSTVVMAYTDPHTRYDVIRWEALLSWGYGSAEEFARAGADGTVARPGDLPATVLQLLG